MSVQAGHCHVPFCAWDAGWSGMVRDVADEEAELGIGFLSLFFAFFAASASLTIRETGRPCGLISGREACGTGGGWVGYCAGGGRYG